MMKNIIKLGAVSMSLLFLWGCALLVGGIVGAGLGVGGYRYVEGSVERDYPLSFHSAWDATNTALANLSISVSNSANEGDQGVIEAVRKDGRKVEIKMSDRGQNVTAVSIRVGLLGAKKDAERIHEEILEVAGLK
jgi:hypothetical protein